MIIQKKNKNDKKSKKNRTEREKKWKTCVHYIYHENVPFLSRELRSISPCLLGIRFLPRVFGLTFILPFLSSFVFVSDLSSFSFLIVLSCFFSFFYFHFSQLLFPVFWAPFLRLMLLLFLPLSLYCFSLVLHPLFILLFRCSLSLFPFVIIFSQFTIYFPSFRNRFFLSVLICSFAVSSPSICAYSSPVFIFSLLCFT